MYRAGRPSDGGGGRAYSSPGLCDPRACRTAAAAGARRATKGQSAPNVAARPTRDVTVTAVVEQENNASYGCAIVRLSGEPGREFGHTTIANTDPPPSTLVAIIVA
ncbi:MAG TPA: hypothetical protein VFS00_34545 [Polyangiaceae bacterium]|nr:hypothetical protein [Polyangiaceae bacterium]